MVAAAAEVATTLSWLWINLLRTLRFPSTAQWLNIVTMSICMTKASHRLKPRSQTWRCNIGAPLRCKASIVSFVLTFFIYLQSISVSVGKLLGINQSSPFRNPLWCRKGLLHELELFRRSKNINAIIAFTSNHRRLPERRVTEETFLPFSAPLAGSSGEELVPEKANFWNIYHSDKSWPNRETTSYRHIATWNWKRTEFLQSCLPTVAFNDFRTRSANRGSTEWGREPIEEEKPSVVISTENIFVRFSIDFLFFVCSCTFHGKGFSFLFCFSCRSYLEQAWTCFF